MKTDEKLVRGDWMNKLMGAEMTVIFMGLCEKVDECIEYEMEIQID